MLRYETIVFWREICYLRGSTLIDVCSFRIIAKLALVNIKAPETTQALQQKVCMSRSTPIRKISAWCSCNAEKFYAVVLEYPLIEV